MERRQRVALGSEALVYHSDGCCDLLVLVVSGNGNNERPYEGGAQILLRPFTTHASEPVVAPGHELADVVSPGRTRNAGA